MVLPEWNKQIFCSKPCYGKAKRGRRSPLYNHVEKVCEVCGESFKRSPSLAARARFCSRKCSSQRASESAYKEPRAMTDGECAWLAGVFDGEGSIIAVRRQRDGNCKGIAISIVNTSKPLMDQIIAFTETGWLNGREPNNPNHLYRWTWRVYGATAVELIRQMRPWLTAKAERADAVLEGRPFPRLPRWEKFYADRPDPVAEEATSE